MARWHFSVKWMGGLVVLALILNGWVGRAALAAAEGTANTDVSTQVAVTFSGLRFNRATQTFDTVAKLTNTSPNPILAPLELHVTGITPASVTLNNANGTAGDGHPYVVVLPDGELAPGATAPNVVLRFNNPSKVQFTFTHRVMGAVPAPATHALQVTLESTLGAGSGTVTSNPAGIDCGNACAADFAAGIPVTLTAIPVDGSVFVGWSGDCGGVLCQVTMSEDRQVTATFALESVGGSGEAPRRVDLVAATSLQGDRIQLDWLATFDNDTPSSDIRYRLHADTTANFVPTSATVRAEVVGGVSGIMTGLTLETLYYVKVEARDQRGNSSWSNELSVTTAAGAPQESAVRRHVLDAQTAPGQIVTADQIRYQLPAGQTPLQPGDLLVSPEGEGFLRRAISVSQVGSEVIVQTEPAALNEVFDNLQFSTDIRLIDVPQTPSSAQVQVLSQKRLASSSSAQTRQVAWPESGLTLIQTEPAAPVASAVRSMARAADDPIFCDGASGQRKPDPDVPLQVTYPEAVCVEPGSQLSIDISAEVQAGYEDRYQVTQLLFLEMTHPKVSKTSTNYGAEWTPNQSDSDTQGKGTLRWTPEEQHVDGQLRPYTARFVALAKERKGHCTGSFGWYCQTRKIEFEVQIGVTWGDLPRPEARRIAGNNADLSIDGTAYVDFQPTIRAESDIRWGHLNYGQIVIQGPIAFESQVRIQATAAAFYANRQPLINRRFIKIFWAGNVPIVINGRFTLDLDYKASADAALDLTQSLDIGFDLEAGLEYRDGQWRVLQKAQPWQRFELTGEADARAEVELRFVPDLQISFYDVATGRLILEPYLYGKAALEGHFLYQLLADGNGVNQDNDADYRFTELVFGGGVDGKFRAGLEVFDKSILGYPSQDPNQFHEFALLARTPIVGLPKLTPRQTPAGNPQDCRAVALTADIENVPNPFRPLFGGPETFNAFFDDSAQWQVVLPNGNETLSPGATLRDVWFSAATSGQYTLRFSGYSGFGSFIRQYEEIQVDYDATADHCGGGSQVIDDFETYAVGPLPSRGSTFENANIVWTSLPGLTPSGSISQSAQSGTKALRLEDFTVWGILKNLFVASATDVSVWMRITDLDWRVPYQFANFGVELKSTANWQEVGGESIGLGATVCKVGDVLAISNDNCLTHVGVFTENEWVKVVMHLDYENSRWRVRVNDSDWSQYLPFFYPRVRYLATITLDTFTYVYDGVVEFDNIQISIPEAVPSDGSCGSIVNDGACSSSLTTNSPGLCSAGEVFFFGAVSGGWAWSCTATNGGTVATCNENKCLLPQ